MATGGRNTPTSKPPIAPKPYTPTNASIKTRPESVAASLYEPPPPPVETKPKKKTRPNKQYINVSERSVSLDNIPSQPNDSQVLNEKRQRNNDNIPSQPNDSQVFNKKKQRNNNRHPPTVRKGILLSTLMDSAKSFPIAATVVTGMYGQLAQSSLYEEKIVLHFEMRLKVVEATVEKGGTHHIPLCSANRFSLLHNPNDNVQQAIMGHYYETIGHIIAQSHKPLVVCATRSFTASSPDASVLEGDILFLSPNIRTKRLKSGKYVKCYNAVTGEEKLLHENCTGGFTTQPERIKMSLASIWESKYSHPPMKVLMYHQLPQVVMTKHTQVTLLSEKWEDSIICTRDNIRESETDNIYGNVQLLRFLKDTGINFIPEKEEDLDPVVYRAYCEETCHLFNEFDYSRIQLHLFNEDPVWPNYEEIQSNLYSYITCTDWERFVLMKKPENAFKVLKRRKSTKNYSPTMIRKATDASLSSSVPASNDVSQTNVKGGQSDYEFLKPITKEELGDATGVFMEDQTIPDFASLLHEVNTVNRQMMIQVESLMAEVEGLKMELKQTKNMMLSVKRELTTSVNELKAEVQQIADNRSEEYVTMENATIKPLASPPDEMAENREILKTLDCNQIQLLLDKLNLSRCKVVFKEKKITGADLANYTEEKLEQDLGVTNRLDRIRLVKICQGCPTVWNLLEESHT